MSVRGPRPGSRGLPAPASVSHDRRLPWSSGRHGQVRGRGSQGSRRLRRHSHAPALMVAAGPGFAPQQCPKVGLATAAPEGCDGSATTSGGADASTGTGPLPGAAAAAAAGGGADWPQSMRYRRPPMMNSSPWDSDVMSPATTSLALTVSGAKARMRTCVCVLAGSTCPTFPSVVTIKEAWTPLHPGTDTRIAQLVALVHAQSQRRTGRTPTYLPMEVSEWRRRMRTPSVPSRLTVTTTGVEGALSVWRRQGTMQQVGQRAA